MMEDTLLCPPEIATLFPPPTPPLCETLPASFEGEHGEPQRQEEQGLIVSSFGEMSNGLEEVSVLIPEIRQTFKYYRLNGIIYFSDYSLSILLDVNQSTLRGRVCLLAKMFPSWRISGKSFSFSNSLNNVNLANHAILNWPKQGSCFHISLPRVRKVLKAAKINFEDYGTHVEIETPEGSDTPTPIPKTTPKRKKETSIPKKTHKKKVKITNTQDNNSSNTTDNNTTPAVPISQNWLQEIPRILAPFELPTTTTYVTPQKSSFPTNVQKISPVVIREKETDREEYLIWGNIFPNIREIYSFAI